jgi:hypothetical protein
MEIHVIDLYSQCIKNNHILNHDVRIDLKYMKLFEIKLRYTI